MKRSAWACAALALLAACGGPDRDPSLGEAYIGPASVVIRSDLSLRSKEVATCRHGEKVDLLAKRRRLIKIRTADGAEGWIDSRQLLSSDEMEEFQRLNEKARKVLSQGKAAADDALNVHTVPNRQSPSVFQLEAKAPVDVVGTTRAPRTAFESRLKMRSLEPPARKAAKKGSAQEKAAPPPAAAPKPAAPVPEDDWLLIRDGKGRAGWVLSRMVFMLVPDEVAQHAERARIVAYFALPHSDAREGKPAWLWATSKKPGEAHQFDSVRLFTYSARRKRYETAFIERDLRGRLPLHVSATAAGSRFAYVFENERGQFMRKEYEYQGVRPRLVQRTIVNKPEPIWLAGEEGEDPERTPDTPESEKNWWRRLREWVAGWRKG